MFCKQQWVGTTATCTNSEPGNATSGAGRAWGPGGAGHSDSAHELRSRSIFRTEPSQKAKESKNAACQITRRNDRTSGKSEPGKRQREEIIRWGEASYGPIGQPSPIGSLSFGRRGIASLYGTNGCTPKSVRAFLCWSLAAAPLKAGTRKNPSLA